MSSKLKGRPRKIPKVSKRLKYFYLICVNFHGKDTLKLGISNNFYRRMKEYNNSETVGYLKYVLNVYKCSDPKRLELVLKYYLPQYVKHIAKLEYFDMKYYELIKESANKISELFGYKLEEIDYVKEYKELIDSNNTKALKKQRKKIKN